MWSGPPTTRVWPGRCSISPAWDIATSRSWTGAGGPSRPIAAGVTAGPCAARLAARARVIPGDHTEEAGIRAAQTLRAEHLPTAVITSNDRCAVGLLDAFARQGVKVPGTVSVVGYDDSMLARLAHVDLTTVSQDAAQQAERAVGLAVERLEGRRTAPREVVLTPHLVVRSTTAPPPDGQAGPGFACPARIELVIDRQR